MRRVAATAWTLVLAFFVTGTTDAGGDREVVISAYQGPSQGGDFAANAGTAQEAIAEASRRGSHFVAFPETFLSGFGTREEIDQGARAIDDPDVEDFIARTAGHEMVVLIGLARRAPDGLYNSVLVIQNGKLLGVYDKVMLTPPERDEFGFRPGRSIPVFEAHGVKFGVVVCADTAYLYPALAARLKGAEILLRPSDNSRSLISSGRRRISADDASISPQVADSRSVRLAKPSPPPPKSPCFPGLSSHR